MTAQTINPVELQARYDAARAANPKLRIRDHANDLDVGEAALVALDCGQTATRLNLDAAALLRRFETLGEVMALTRNHHAVHEKIGTYRNISVEGPQGLVLDPEIDLRVFLGQWAHAFTVTEQTGNGPRESIQIFDAAGDAVHKIYLRPESDRAAYAALVEAFRSTDQSQRQPLNARAIAKADRPDSEIDIDGFRAAWRNMRDTHEFFGLLRKFGVGRLQGLRLAGAEFARSVSNGAARYIFESAVEKNQSIMVFVGNPGMIQIHTGVIHRVVPTPPWINIMDPRFNLHLRETDIAASWVVEKPTEDGIVTSLELFDATGSTIAMIFGERKPGKPELEGWRALVRMLEQEQAAA